MLSSLQPLNAVHLCYRNFRGYGSAIDQSSSTIRPNYVSYDVSYDLVCDLVYVRELVALRCLLSGTSCVCLYRTVGLINP